MIAMASAFVILLHTGHGAAHFDLMLPRAGALATWQLPEDPAALGVGQSSPARRLADHRTAYLTYQGPVSAGRGTVRQAHAGTCLILHADDTCWQVRMEGQTCRALFELRRIEQEGTGQGEADRWEVRRVE